uniref:NADH-ubiquinone oxidoreductase chain 4L n=1 Tax=Petrobiellus sp. 1 JZ-2014 TaxID=1529458 RepID=A0A0B4N627_9INSE|nr:NADH dehydrogenase subunit 4L [Petrobiellus sp. 1 JZ-2014]
MDFFMVLFLVVPLFMVMSGSSVYVSKRKHLLAVLFSLEYIMLGLYMYMSNFLLYFNISVYFGLMFLTFVVCEGSMALSILVSMVRLYGSDYFNSFSILEC